MANTISKLLALQSAHEVDPMQSFAKGYGVGDLIRQSNERQDEQALSERIGGMLASGDRTGAAQAAYGAGALDMGSKLEGAQEDAIKQLGTFAAQILSLPAEQQEGVYMAGAPQMMALARRAGLPVPNEPEPYDDNQRAAMRAIAARAGALSQPKAGSEQLVKTYDPRTKQTVYTPRSQAAGMRAPPPASPVSVNMPQFGVIDTDDYGNPIRGFIDRANRSVTPLRPQGGGTPFLDAASGAAAIPEGAGPDWRNEQFLASLPERVANEVKALSEGRMAPPTGKAATSPHFLKVLDATRRYDPGFDYNDYKTRYRTRADFAAGVAARNITAHNTALKHIAGMVEAVEDLNNTSIPGWNSVVNMLGQQTGHAKTQAAVRRFDTVKKAVADEMAKVFAGTNSALADREAWEEKFSSADSPAASKR